MSPLSVSTSLIRSPKLPSTRRALAWSAAFGLLALPLAASSKKTAEVPEPPTGNGSVQVHTLSPDHPPASAHGDEGLNSGETVSVMLAAAEKRWAGGQVEQAELIFAETLSLPVPLEQKRDVLLRMADLYGDEDVSRAIIIIEKFLQTYPGDPATGRLLLRLGSLYRGQGAYDVASSRYFSVLNVALRDGAVDLSEARKNSTKARFELAEMLAEQDRLLEAAVVYRKIELLDLSPADRRTVEFRLACVSYEIREYEAAAGSFASMRNEQPDGPYRLESAYYLAASLKALGREREAFEVVVDLLRSQISQNPEDLAQSIYWKRRTGNELANEFYEQGEYLSALTIYQALARMSDAPEWRWPAVYQIGLCFEHLELPQRALEAYQAMLEGIPVQDGDLVQADVSLRDLARWRLDHVKWMLDYGERFRIMTGSNNVDS